MLQEISPLWGLPRKNANRVKTDLALVSVEASAFVVVGLLQGAARLRGGSLLQTMPIHGLRSLKVQGVQNTLGAGSVVERLQRLAVCAQESRAFRDRSVSRGQYGWIPQTASSPLRP